MSIRPLLVGLGAGLVAGAGVGSVHYETVTFWRTRLFSHLGAIMAPASGSAECSTATPGGVVTAAMRVVQDTGRFAVLSTVDSRDSTGSTDVGLSSRLIQPWAPGTDSDSRDNAVPQVSSSTPDADPLTLHFNTSSTSRKAAELEANPSCTITYVHAPSLSYVTLVGRATRVRGTEAKRHWSETLRLFYPDGPDRGVFSTWRFQPSRVQVVSAASGLYSQRDDSRAPELQWRGEGGGAGRWVMACDGTREYDTSGGGGKGTRS